MKEKADVIIIGAGITGLSCARFLDEAGKDYLVLESDSREGGRIKSDILDGFTLDHGFQVLQTAYPEVRDQLDLGALELRPFTPGVAVRLQKKRHYISDPVRRPADLWRTLKSQIGTLGDRWRVVKLFWDIKTKGTRKIFEEQDIQTIDFLRSYGFSEEMIQQFFRPFFAGACLDPDIRASSRIFQYLFNIFSSGDAALPAKGMGAIPLQLAERLAPDRIRFDAGVATVEADGVTLDNGEKIKGRIIVIAAQEPETHRLIESKTHRISFGERCLYYAAQAPPIREPFLMLNGENRGLINNIAVPSLTAPEYSSTGEALIAVVVLKNQNLDDSSLEGEVRKELLEWFGRAVEGWRHLRTYHIRHALPDQSPPLTDPHKGFKTIRKNLYACGEYDSVPGIQWALLSGRLTAEQILKTG